MSSASASISRARWAAVVSVEKYGMPIPAPKMTTRPFSRWRMARSGMYGSATWPMVMAVWTRVSMPSLLQEVLEREAVHDGAEHAHVVGAGAVHAALLQFGAAEEVAAADDDGDLGAVADDGGDLAGDRVHHVGVDAQAPAAGERLTGQLQHEPAA